jgi:hypothetical protein
MRQHMFRVQPQTQRVCGPAIGRDRTSLVGNYESNIVPMRVMEYLKDHAASQTQPVYSETHNTDYTEGRHYT